MLWHGKNFRGILTKAKEMIFDNTGTNLVSTNAEDAIKEVNSNMYSKNLTVDNVCYVRGNVTPTTTSGSVTGIFGGAIDDIQLQTDVVNIVDVTVEKSGTHHMHGYIYGSKAYGFLMFESNTADIIYTCRINGGSRTFKQISAS